jgi:hypothetical protein
LRRSKTAPDERNHDSDEEHEDQQIGSRDKKGMEHQTDFPTERQNGRQTAQPAKQNQKPEREEADADNQNTEDSCINEMADDINGGHGGVPPFDFG